MSHAKRQIGKSGSSTSSSKRPRTTFKARPIEISAASAGGAHLRIVEQNTRSFQVYELSDGRIGAWRDDSKIQVPISALPIPDPPQDESPEDLTATILDGLPVEEAEQLRAAVSGKKQRKRPELRAAAKVRQWLPLREEFLDEMLRYIGSEYPVDTEDVQCRDCKSSPAHYRCVECVCRQFHCKACLLERHKDMPLHVFEHWDGSAFHRVSLRDLDSVVQLGHDGEDCPSPSPTARGMVIGDLMGIHEVSVRFCHCLDEDDHFSYEWVQLFRHGWFPASTAKPSTAFTFRLLDFFQEVNSQAKTNLWDFWQTLERITDNSGAAPAVDRYKQMSHAMRIWQHLVSLKRAGRAHDPTGAAGTTEGELAVECPACLQPGKNIPDDWEQAPENVKWLYTLFLMMDANFRAKLKDRGLDNFEIAPGWSYYVENKGYKKHVDSLPAQTDRSNCSAEHQVIQNANLRRDGYLASGVGAVLCARHALVRRNGVGDIPNGEKYGLMDFLVFSTIFGLSLLLLLSYDIACQWHKNLPDRVQALPEKLRRGLANIRYAIPKKHIRVHGLNHSQWSFNYLRWVGRTYGEGIEAHWSHINPLALSAREMGPGMRHELMNDHWGSWNWQKIIGLGPSLLRKLREADEMFKTQVAAHEGLEENLPEDQIQKWKQVVETWLQNPGTGQDPFEEPRTTATVNSTRLKIAEEEAKELAAGTLPPHDTTPGVFINLGLDLEDQQRALCTWADKGATAMSVKADLQEKRNSLKRRIELFQAIQDVHMPILVQYRSGDTPIPCAPPSESGADHPSTQSTHPDQPPVAAQPPSDQQPVAPSARTGATPANSSMTKAEDIPLLLPSSLAALLRASLPAGLVDKERRLRITQADDGLEEIWRVRRILAGIREFRRFNITGTGQRTDTRARSLYTKFQDKLRRAVDQYRTARTALLAIDPRGEWTAHFKLLREEDIRGPGREEDEDNMKKKRGREADHVGEGYYTVSWIWTVARGPGLAAPSEEERQADPGECLDNMRVEWARSQARADRWSEERQLLEEEMRWTIEFFEWKIRWWRLQATRRPQAPQAVERGLKIYAERQVRVFGSLAQRCATLWIPYLRVRSMGVTLPPWTLRYKPTPKGRGKGRVPQTRTVQEDSSESESSEESEDAGIENVGSDNEL